MSSLVSTIQSSGQLLRAQAQNDQLVQEQCGNRQKVEISKTGEAPVFGYRLQDDDSQACFSAIVDYNETANELQNTNPYLSDSVTEFDYNF